jgi:DNA polymerase V
MGFPVPGDAIEQSLDLNRYLVSNRAATFFMRVDGDVHTNGDVQPGDLLIVDRSLAVTDHALVVAAIAGELTVLRVCHQDGQLHPEQSPLAPDMTLEIWGVVTTIIRRV